MIHNPTQHYLFLSYLNKVLDNMLIGQTIRSLERGQDFRTVKRAKNLSPTIDEQQAWNLFAWYARLEHLNDSNLHLALKSAKFDKEIDKELLNEHIESINLPPLQ